MLKKIIISLLALLCAFGAEASDLNSKKVKIGVIVPLSGEAASIGEAVKNSMLMAYEKLPSQKQSKIELLFEDDGLQPKNAVTAFNKLVSVNGAQVIINVSSGTAKAISPLAEQKKIPFLAVASDPQIVAGRKYVMNFWVSPEEETRIMLPEIVRQGYKNLARISTIQEGVLSANRAFDAQNNGKVKIAIDEEYAPDVKDFKPFIAKLQNAKEIDAVLVGLLPGQLGIFAKQLRQSGVTIPIFGWEILEDSNEVKASDGALVGAWYVNAADPSNTFLSEYRKRFPDGSLFAAANGYDLILLMGEAVGQSTDSEEINRFLHTLKDFEGTLGRYSASSDNRFTLPAAIKVVTATGFETRS